MTNRCSSTRENRVSGRSCVRGSSHAIALTSATCCGGKTTRPAWPRLVAQSVQAMFGKPSSPTPDQPGRRVQPRRDLGVGDPVGGVEHDPRALNVLEGQLLGPRDPLKLTTLVAAELDPITRRARHRPKVQRERPDPFNRSDQYFRTGLLARRAVMHTRAESRGPSRHARDLGGGASARATRRARRSRAIRGRSHPRARASGDAAYARRSAPRPLRRAPT
jgi:hypothetical protein